FLRTHQSHLVNPKYVKSWLKEDGGMLLLISGEKIPVSKPHKETVKQALQRSTYKGLQVYEVVKDKKIADVAMTAEWEMAFQKIENNEAEADAFHRDMEAYATSITRELLDTGIAKERNPN